MTSWQEMVDEEAAQAIRPLLARGETLLWADRPAAGLRLRAQDAVLVPFSILWCGFAIFWVVGASGATRSHHGGPMRLFPLFGVPFVAAGLFMVFGRFFWDAWVRSRTRYGVTTERVLIVGGVSSSSERSVPLASLTEISVTQRADGTGTVTLGPASPLGAAFTAGSRQRLASPQLEMIPNARAVHDLVRTAQKAALAAR